MRMLVTMRLNWLLTLILLAWQIAPAQAQVVTVTVQSIDGLLDAARYSLTMAGQEDQAKQLDGLIEAFLQGEGFKGIETKKPFGSYINKFSGNPIKPPVVGFIPVTKEQEFLDFLSRLNVTGTKENKDLRTIDLPTGQKLFLRFSAGYAFVAESDESLKNLIDPATFSKSLPATALVQVHFNFDQIPAPLKTLVLSGMDKELAKKKEKQSGESDEEFQGRRLGMKMAQGFFAHLVEDSKAVSVTLSLDKAKHQFAFESTLQAKQGSALQQQFQQMALSKTAFASLTESAPAFLAWHGTIDESLRGELNKLVDAALQAGLSKEKSVVKRAVAEKVFKALEPTLKSNIFDAVVSLHGGQDRQPLTGIAAIRVKNGKQIEQLVRDLVEETKGKEREHIKLDADKIGDVALHVIEGPAEDEKGKDAARIFGALKITIAFHDEAIFVALGEKSIEEVKRAVTQFNQPAKNQPASLQIDFHGRAFTHFEKDADKRKAFEKALSEPGSDLIRVTLRGGDDLQFRVQVSSHYLKLAEALKDKGE